MNEEYKKDFIKAGALAGEVRAFGKALIKKGASYNSVVVAINQKIAELGARAAFPPQIALNHVAAHFLPEPGEDIIFSDEVVKLDVGVCWNGAIGDCAVTIDLSGRYGTLIEAVEAALLAAEQTVKVGVPLNEIGKVIEDTISSFGFSPVKNLSGHGLGHYQIHRPPVVPNYKDRTTALIKPGMTFAIEPFACNGRGFIHESGQPTIFSLIKTRPTRSAAARAVLEEIKTFNGLPFAIHHFVDKLPLAEVRQGIRELLETGAIGGYPPLIEDVKCMVAQAENSVLVDKEGKVFITTRL